MLIESKDQAANESVLKFLLAMLLIETDISKNFLAVID